jgi:ribosomal protein L27
MTVRITKDGIETFEGAFVLERQIESDVNGVARKMRRAVKNSADAAEDSLNKSLSKHVRSGQLIGSIESVISKDRDNVYSASTSVGLGVEHSIYFFEDTRQGVADLFSGAASDKLYGPTNDGRGPKYLQTFRGYKGHEEYITRAQNKASSVLRREVREINRGT